MRDELKAAILESFHANSYEQGLKKGREVIARYRQRFPSAMKCMEEDPRSVSSGATCAFYLFIRQPMGSEVGPAARNTLDSARIPRASKLLICGLLQKGRVLAQDGI